jgi:hypothetical protein
MLLAFAEAVNAVIPLEITPGNERCQLLFPLHHEAVVGLVQGKFDRLIE